MLRDILCTLDILHFIYIPFLFSSLFAESMVLKLDGSSGHVAHFCTEPGSLIWIRHLVASIAVANLM